MKKEFEKKILLVGVGEQGIKAGKAVPNDLNRMDKLYIDAGSLTGVVKYSNERCLSIPFEVELAAWSISYPIQEWMKQKENEEILRKYFNKEKYPLVIFMAGLGGTQSLVVKELIRWLNRENPKTTTFFIASLPFKNETNYKTNFLTRKMMDFLRKNVTSYMLVENESVIRKEGGYIQAYTESYKYLSELVTAILSLLASETWMTISMEDLCIFFRQKGLVYYSKFDACENQRMEMMIKNPILPYSVKREGTVIVSIDYHQDAGLLEFEKLREKLEDYFKAEDYIWRLNMDREKTHDKNMIILAPGSEAGRKIDITDLKIL